MKIEGLIAATFATFHEDGSLNLDMIPELVNKLIEDGLRGVFICGTNGEGPNLTVEERMAVAEAYVKAVDKRMLTLVHVGHTSIAEARKLATHAALIGADAISSVAAFYFKPASVESLVLCMAEIASAAPQTPFYYYHVPALTSVGLDMFEFLRLAEQRIPNLAGIKYTSSTLNEYQACLNYKAGKFDILFGYDEMLLAALSVGAKGAIGSTYTFAGQLYLHIMDLYSQGRQAEAQAMQLQSVEMVRCLGKYSPIPAQRAIMNMLGFNLGPCRLPLEDLVPEQAEELKEALEACGFFALLNKCEAV
jgi:N-acetylneuraminate lyase